MRGISNLLMSVITIACAASVKAAEVTPIKLTDKVPLFDGRCNDKEWQTATKLSLPAQVSVYLMHNDDALFVCARGKKQDYTVIDLYIEHTETGELYNLHASAQLNERTFADAKWRKTDFWNQKGWGGFWVPYAGEKETDSGNRTQFLTGSDREIQVLRKKFSGDTWRMMVRVSAVYHQGEYGAEFFYPEQASDTDKSTWTLFSFTQEK